VLTITVVTEKATSAVTLNLVKPFQASKDKQPPRIHPEGFHPEYVYPIYGDEEQIFGYKNLNINIDFRANDLRPSFKITYDEKWKPIGETQAMDVEGPLREFLPPSKSLSYLYICRFPLPDH